MKGTHEREREGLSFDTRLRCIRMMNFSILFCSSIHIHESEIFYGCYAAVVVADDRSIYCVLNCCCSAAIRKLQIMRKTSLFYSIFSGSSKIPAMSMKICIIIILNYYFLRVQHHHILTLYRNSSQQNRKSLNFHFQFQNSHGYWIINYVRAHLNQKCRIHTRMDPRATKLTKKRLMKQDIWPRPLWKAFFALSHFAEISDSFQVQVKRSLDQDYIVLFA